jgi:exodeoxyribonuclease III
MVSGLPSFDVTICTPAFLGGWVGCTQVPLGQTALTDPTLAHATLDGGDSRFGRCALLRAAAASTQPTCIGLRGGVSDVPIGKEIRCRIATWNVNGIRARAPQVVQWVEKHRPTVLCLQEIKAAPEQIDPLTVSMPGYNTFWHGKLGGYSGVSLHCAEDLGKPEFYIPPFDMETRIVVAKFDQLHIAAIYAPNGGKDYDAKLRFYRAMIAWSKSVVDDGQELLLCGDLNITRSDLDVHPNQRDADVIGQRTEERELFAELLATGVVDTGRQLMPDAESMFTWWPYWKAAKLNNMGWRIDYVLASAELAKRAVRHDVQATYGTSDHAPVVTDFADGTI